MFENSYSLFKRLPEKVFFWRSDNFEKTNNRVKEKRSVKKKKVFKQLRLRSEGIRKQFHRKKCSFLKVAQVRITEWRQFTSCFSCWSAVQELVPKGHKAGLLGEVLQDPKGVLSKETTSVIPEISRKKKRGQY